MDILRDYQREVLDRLEEAWTRVRSVMVQMPTGTGKTVLLAETIRKEMRNERSSSARLLPEGRKKGEIFDLKVQSDLKVERRNVLVVAHRRELIEQIEETLTQFIGDSVQFITVESIQKLTRSNHNYPLSTINYQLIIIDEAHHAVAKTYRELWERWPEARFLGLTATPCRLSGEAFTDLFDTLLQAEDIQWFIDRGWLSDFDYISAAPDNRMMQQVRGLRKRGVGGDYQEREMCAVLDVPESIAHLYKTYKSFADGKKGIVYAINQQHAHHIAEYYHEQGLSCAVIDSRTEQGIRKETVEQYRRGAIDILVNVDIFGEGFDVPEVEFIQLARPTLSLAKYLQQVGRGMRISQGKEAVLILDQVGMYQTFGLPTDERDWRGMFLGQQAGKGNQGNVRGIVVRDDLNDKELVNLEMVRIKRRGETHQGLEVFLQEGRYGIMKDGKVICAPEIEKVERTEAPYFAMCVYPYMVWKNRVDIVDKDGHLFRPGLYGKVKRQGDVFIGDNQRGETVYWDAKGGRFYQRMPTFEQLGRFAVARIGGQVYMRYKSKLWSDSIRANSIYLHKDFVIIDGGLVFWKEPDRKYEVCGYDDYHVYIKKTWRYNANCVFASLNAYGGISEYLPDLPPRVSDTPKNMGNVGLRQVYRDRT